MHRVKPMGGGHSQNAGPGLSYLKGGNIPQNKGPRTRWQAPHAWNVPHPWALPIVEHELSIIMNLKILDHEV